MIDDRNPLDADRLRAFKGGWTKSGDRTYEDVLKKLTWDNCGYRLGKILGPQDDDVKEKLAHFLEELRQAEAVREE